MSRAPVRTAGALLLVLFACARVPEPEVPPAARPLAVGKVSFYGEDFRGRLTANGERFDPDGLTAAHRRLPFGSCLVVENTENGRRVKVRVNDRGPYVEGRILDVSLGAAKVLKMTDAGVVRARLWRCDEKG